MDEETWQKIHEEMGCDIMSIVMDFQAGRVSAGDTMDRIGLHCEAAYRAGQSQLKAENERLRERYYKLNANWLRDVASVMWTRGWCHVCARLILPPKYYHAVDCDYETWATENRPKKGQEALGGEGGHR